MTICISWVRTSGGFDAKSYKLNSYKWGFLCKIVQVEFQESLLKMRTSGIRTSWDRTSGGPPVLGFRRYLVEFDVFPNLKYLVWNSKNVVYFKLEFHRLDFFFMFEINIYVQELKFQVKISLPFIILKFEVP